MRLTSPSRRALGIVAVSTIGMSTAVLGATGVAQATTATHVTSATTLTIASGMCGVHVVATGASGGSVGGNAGGLAEFQEFDLTVQAGDTVSFGPGAVGTVTAGGAGGEGANGGNGGAGAAGGGGGTSVNLNGALVSLAAGGGGGGTQAAGGNYGTGGAPYSGTNGNYNGGDAATDSAAGAGGTTDDPNTPPAAAGNNGSGKAGGAGSAGAGGGGGGLFGGGGGASDGTDGAGGGGGYSLYSDNARLNPVNADIAAGPGAGSVDYTLRACTADDAPLAPHDVTAQGSNGTLTVDFQPTWSETGGLDPDTWEYQLNSGSWTLFTPSNSPDGGSELALHSLTNGTAYTVHVRGVSSDGIKGVAASVTGTPFAPIGAPTHVAFTVSGSVVTFTWDAPTTTGTYPLAGYQAFLFYSNGQSGGLAFECDTDITVHTCTAPAPPGPEYSGGVNAVDSADNAGDPSDMLRIGKIAPPSSVPAANGPLAAPSGTGSSGSVVKGQKVTLHGTGYAPNSLVSVLAYSTPQVLTTVMTDGSGSFTVEVTVPAGLPDGHHTLVAAGADSSGHMRYLTLPITVTGGSAELAYTGASVLTPALAGLGALVLGGGLLMVSRRRSPR